MKDFLVPSFKNKNYLDAIYNFAKDSSVNSTIIKRIKYERENYLFLNKVFIGNGVMIYAFDGSTPDAICETIYDYNDRLKLVCIYTDNKIYVTDMFMLFSDSYMPLAISILDDYKDKFFDFNIEYKNVKKEVSRRVFNDFVEKLDILENCKFTNHTNKEAIGYLIKNIDHIEQEVPELNDYTTANYVKSLLGIAPIEEVMVSIFKTKEKDLQIRKSEVLGINELLANPSKINFFPCAYDIITALRGIDGKNVSVTYINEKTKEEKTVKIPRGYILDACNDKGYIWRWHCSPTVSSDIWLNNITEITFSRKVLYKKK